ncbi:amino acid adenylation domain-containing protein, partial [Gordonia phosphorivorans]
MIGIELNRAFCRILGSAPSTVDLLAFAALQSGRSVAFTAPSGPISFAELQSRTAPLAAVFAAQGLDPDAAVSGAVTPLFVQAGLEPAAAGAATKIAVSDIRRAVFDLVGSADLGSLPGVFRSIATRFPDRPAVSDYNGVTLSYRELDERSEVLAAGLIADGAGPEACIGVAMPRDVDLVVALLGIMKSGAAYVPLDRSHPMDRLAKIIEDADPVVILADPVTAAEWDGVSAPIVTVEHQMSRALADTRAAVGAAVSSVHPAYVIYTSGSTGTPKGVAVAHGALVALISAMGAEYDYSHTDSWSQYHSYAFDLSVGEIWMPLAVGGRLVILDGDTARDPGAFVDALEREQITVVNQTPSAFYQLAAALRGAGGRQLPSALRSMIFVGEALDFGQVRRWYADRRQLGGNDGPELNNMYGPTEATVYMTRRRLTPEFAADATGDVGLALPGSAVYVLDARLAKVPDGVPGDLYIAGRQLARGYAGRAALNATRFVADPYGAPGERMYLSGDRALVRNGSLEFLGRGDDQVKLRGYRIELGEVESGLLSAPGVQAAAAAIKDGSGGTDLLVGYVVGTAEETGALDVAEIRQHTRSVVPDYMVPDAVVVLDELPLTVNGKLDRRALPAPDFSSGDYVAPEDGVERTLAIIFSDVLGVEKVSAVDSFHDLGGNSLLAARIIGRASEELDVELNLRDLFEAPSIRELAVRAAESAPALPPITKVEKRPERIPLSFAQQRMWFLNQFDLAQATYNIPAVMRLTGRLDTAALRSAVVDVVVRHEILRTEFPAVEGIPYQAVSSVDDVEARLSAVWKVVHSQEALFASVTNGFDITKQWPLRVMLWPISDEEHVLGLVVHHIAADGESMLPLVTEVVAAYAARVRGATPDFAPLPVQFADYAIWQHDVLGSPEDPDSIVGRQLAYWRERLVGAPDVLELPGDRPRPAVATHTGVQAVFDIPSSLATRVTEFARTHGVTPFMVTHAVFAVLMARLSATDDVIVGTPVAGRGQAVLDRLIGMFVNTLVLRTDVDLSEPFGELLARVREIDLDAFAHADVPFETLVEAVDPVRSEAFSPLVQVIFSFDPAGAALRASHEVDGLDFAAVEGLPVPAQLDMNFALFTGEAGAGWSGEIIGAADMFDLSTLESMGVRFVALLDALTADPA